MKNILFFILFFAVNICAQDIVTDTTYITNVGGVFFQNNEQTYNDGKQIITRTPMGDTVTTVSKFAAQYASEGDRMAADIAVIRKYRALITTLVSSGNSVAAVVGQNPLKNNRDELAPGLIAGSWTIRNGATSAPIVFSVTQAGVFRHTVNGGTARPIDVISTRCIRLRSYPATGSNTDMFKVGNFWSDATGAITIRSN